MKLVPQTTFDIDPTHFLLCIMYYFVRSHHLYHENDPTLLPHLVLELCIILCKWTTNTPLSPHPCQLPFNLYWNYVLCYELFSDIMLLNWPQRSLLSWRHRNDTTLVLELGIMLWNWAQRSFYIKYHQYHPLSDNTITIHHVLWFEILPMHNLTTGKLGTEIPLHQNWQHHPLSDNTITIHHVLCFEILI